MSIPDAIYCPKTTVATEPNFVKMPANPPNPSIKEVTLSSKAEVIFNILINP
uniref:Uncharacterized protein n=1 Tax=Siphoviridae sp. ctxMM9 TaxID=2827973 RepID=A0A8S5T6E9_9CAUD|nr:MAG TPA: hypothetical protein [Siphoviridae sp. ctxMM9]